MILEAFAEYLHAADQKVSATSLLGLWLWERLSMSPESLVDKVIHCEILCEIKSIHSESQSFRSLPQSFNDGSPIHEGNSPLYRDRSPLYAFTGKSDTGRMLLKSLYEYCLSYEQQKWSRWVHSVKASDFGCR